MTSHWLFQLALLAVVLFWLVGAYNRLVRLRAAVGVAWVQLVGALGKRSEAMAAVIEAVREPLASEAATLQALADADAQVRAAASPTSRPGPAPRRRCRRLRPGCER